MLAALSAIFRRSALDAPEGGLFLWVTLPTAWTRGRCWPRRWSGAWRSSPAPPFRAPDDAHGGQSLRLNFSHAEPELIDEGLRRLGEVVAPGTAQPALIHGS